MKFRNSILRAVLFALVLIQTAAAQTKTQQPVTKSGASPTETTKEENTDAYVALLRRDVRQEKAEIMGATLALSAQDAAKFWPIYGNYDTELASLND